MGDVFKYQKSRLVEAEVIYDYRTGILLINLKWKHIIAIITLLLVIIVNTFRKVISDRK